MNTPEFRAALTEGASVARAFELALASLPALPARPSLAARIRNAVRTEGKR